MFLRHTYRLISGHGHEARPNVHVSAPPASEPDTGCVLSNLLAHAALPRRNPTVGHAITLVMPPAAFQGARSVRIQSK